MDTFKYMEQFEMQFSKLRNNRERIPIEVLTTRYAKAYSELVDWLEHYVEWYVEEYIKAISLPVSSDATANEWLQRKIEEIKAEEKKPHGMYHQIRDSLIEQLDKKQFEDKISQFCERLEREAYFPYQQTFNRWVGKPENRMIYNSLFDAFWKENKAFREGGYWMDRSGNVKYIGFPPTAVAVQESA